MVKAGEAAADARTARVRLHSGTTEARGRESCIFDAFVILTSPASSLVLARSRAWSSLRSPAHPWSPALSSLFTFRKSLWDVCGVADSRAGPSRRGEHVRPQRVCCATGDEAQRSRDGWRVQLCNNIRAKCSARLIEFIYGSYNNSSLPRTALMPQGITVMGTASRTRGSRCTRLLAGTARWPLV